MSRDPQSQSGFTLIELLIAIAIMALVIPAVAGAFYVSYRTISGTTGRVSSSAGTALATSWYGPDVQSSRSLSTTAPDDCTPPGSVLLSLALPGGSVTWFTDGTNLGRMACLSSDAKTYLVPLENSTVSRSCDPACVYSATLVTVEFTPKESGTVRLSASRRNPDAAS